MAENNDPKTETNSVTTPPSRKRRKTNDYNGGGLDPELFRNMELLPSSGRLQFLKTKAEVKAGHETGTSCHSRSCLFL